MKVVLEKSQLEALKAILNNVENLEAIEIDEHAIRPITRKEAREKRYVCVVSQEFNYDPKTGRIQVIDLASQIRGKAK